ncbi:MAG: hypothetical protein ABGZ23_27445 [Fuerstiella sp.]
MNYSPPGTVEPKRGDGLPEGSGFAEQQSHPLSARSSRLSRRESDNRDHRIALGQRHSTIDADQIQHLIDADNFPQQPQTIGCFLMLLDPGFVLPDDQILFQRWYLAVVSKLAAPIRVRR